MRRYTRRSPCARRLSVALILLLAIAVTARPARAAGEETVSKILKLLASAGLVDQAIVDAQSLIECLLEHSAAECVDLQSAAVAKGKAEAAKVVPSDPKVKTAVAVIRAVNDGDWLLVLELTSTDLLGQIACDAAMAPTAAVKTVVCGPIFAEVSGMAKPVVKGVIHAFATSPPDIWALVSLVGLPTACEIAPDMPLKDEVCGILGQAFAILTEAASQLASQGWGLVTGFGEVVGGQSDAMPQAEYYAKEWQRWLHQYVMYSLQGAPSLSFNWQHDRCVEYFDGHKYSGSHAKEACDAMQGRFAKEVLEVSKAMKAARAPYYQAHLAPQLDFLILQRYWSLDALLAWLAGQQSAAWAPSFAQANATLGEEAGKLFMACEKDMEAVYILGYRQSDPMYPAEFHTHATAAWGYNCLHIFTDHLAPAMTLRRAGLQSALGATGCELKKQGYTGDRIDVTCGSYPAFQQCRSLVPAPEAAGGVVYCGVNGLVADPKLAKTLATELGRRCLAGGNNDVNCTRPWRAAECEYYKAEATEGYGSPVYVTCKDLSNTDSMFVAGKKEAAQIALALNGGAVLPSSETFNVFLPPTTDNCYTNWDPLAVVCRDASALETLGQKLPGTDLSKCPPDPNRDGADEACYAGPLNALAGNDAPVSDEPVAVPLPTEEPAPAPERPAAPEARNDPGARALPAPDLLEMSNFSVAGRTVTWGTAVRVDAANGTPAGAGCRVTVRHFPRNLGEGTSGPFDTEWRNSAVRGSTPTERKSLRRGEFREEVDEVVLFAGENRLTLVLDPEDQLAETDETNNAYEVRVELVGTCGLRRGGDD